MTVAAPNTPTTPVHEPRAIARVQPSANPATIRTSHPLFGPWTPLKVTDPSRVHVENTPTATAPIATQGATRVADGRASLAEAPSDT